MVASVQVCSVGLFFLVLAVQGQTLQEAQVSSDATQVKFSEVKHKLIALIEAFNKTQTQLLESQCPKDIGSNSSCIRIANRGCYCIVEVLKGLNEAEEFCKDQKMQLVAMENKEEWDHVVDFLNQNLGSRGEYESDFYTSGAYANGQWRWSSSDLPLLFKNWDSSKRNTETFRKVLAVQRKGQSFKWTQVRPADNSGNPFPLYFMCEGQATGPKSQLQNSMRAMECPNQFGSNATCTFMDQLGCYCIVQDLKSWKEANDSCRTGEMDLVSIETADEQNQVAALLWENKEGDHYEWGFWTSGAYVKDQNQWQWTATGRKVEYTNWSIGYPNVTQQVDNALALFGGPHEWLSGRVDARAFYVCEKALF